MERPTRHKERRVGIALLHSREGGSDTLDIAVVETSHADAATGDEVDAELGEVIANARAARKSR